MRILVLGHKGMLGHMVYKVLNNNYKVKTIDERFPNWNKEMFNDVDICFKTFLDTTTSSLPNLLLIVSASLCNTLILSIAISL